MPCDIDEISLKRRRIMLHTLARGLFVYCDDDVCRRMEFNPTPEELYRQAMELWSYSYYCHSSVYKDHFFGSKADDEEEDSDFFLPVLSSYIW